ncbi:hypothetical protein C289_2340, partial [Anoxybacillus ayderensis]
MSPNFLNFSIESPYFIFNMIIKERKFVHGGEFIMKRNKHISSTHNKNHHHDHHHHDHDHGHHHAHHQEKHSCHHESNTFSSSSIHSDTSHQTEEREKHEDDEQLYRKLMKKWWFAGILSVPIILGSSPQVVL